MREDERLLARDGMLRVAGVEANITGGPGVSQGSREPAPVCGPLWGAKQNEGEQRMRKRGLLPLMTDGCHEACAGL